MQRQLIKYASVFLTVLALYLPAHAHAKCYTMKEAEAEQGIRIHSELMVIALNCQHLSKTGKNLYVQYKEFTNDHGSLISGYETTLMSFYQSEGQSDPERKLHDVRTNFANKISKDAAVMRPDAFCHYYMPRISKAAQMSNQDVRKWAATIFPSHPVSRPLCANATK